MGRFDGYKSILKGCREELEKLIRMRNDEIASAKSRFNASALPEELKSINAEYDGLIKAVRSKYASKLKTETATMRHKNMDKFIPNYVDDTFLTELNLVSAANIPLTQSEVEAYCERALKSRSDFCVRKVIAMAKDSGFCLNVPSEQAANDVITQTDSRLKEIIEKYDGNPSFGYGSGNVHRDQSITMDAKGGFLDRKEKDYEEKMVEDISISSISQVDYNHQKQKEAEEKEIEITEIGHVGVSAKPDSLNSPAAKAARSYSARVQGEPSPEFE